ncbi:MAG: Spy/CpxP family protein refolding chaperone [Terriglobales bacterium]
MKLKFLVVTLVLFFATGVLQAQTPRPAPDGPPFHQSFMGNWNPPAALTTDWWNNPDIANDLRLTEAQKKQLEQVSTNVKLTLIDAGATGLKSYVRLQSLLDGDPFDRAAYNQELDAASTAASRLVKEFGQMAVAVRTILTAEQWHKLKAMKSAGRMRARPHPDPAHDGMHGHIGPAPTPPSLHTPPQ